MSTTIALVGNPNSGKTTLYNQLTGSNQTVGNWPGVTVEKKVGRLKSIIHEVTVIDLPGIYSLSPMSVDEVIAREYVEKGEADVIINIVDASNLQRNLFLTLQLMEMNKPIVVALNMMDVLSEKGFSLDVQLLSDYLQIPIIPIVASKGIGLKQLVDTALNQKNVIHTMPDFYSDQTKALITQLKESLAKDNSCTTMSAIRFIEEGPEAAIGCELDVVAIAKLNMWVDEQVSKMTLDRDMIVSDEKYRFITSVANGALTRISEDKTPISEKIDAILTHRVFAIPLFLLIMYGVFFTAFGPVGQAIKERFEIFIEWLIVFVASGLMALEVSDLVFSLVIDGIFGGVGAILSFLPEISVLFLMLSLLESTGYMARAAFIMDRMFRRFGLSGRSFIPMLMGFGCTVPALMATRTLDNEKERRLTMFITPFMSCGAKFPVYAIFVAAFFSNNQAMVVFSIYLIGIVVAIISGIFLKRFINKGKTTNFIMELPDYRLPTIQNLALATWERVKGFIVGAGTVLLLAMIIIWFLQSFNFQLQLVEDSAQSIFGVIGRSIAFIFAPLGFGEWRATMSLIVGLVAKEAVVGTLGILYGVGEAAIDSPDLLAGPLKTVFTPISAYSFMIFTLLYMPCVAAFAAMKREMNSWKWTLLAVGYQTTVAWVLAFGFYQIASLIVG